MDSRNDDAAVDRILAGFQHLDGLLSDGRPFLSGAEFSISDVAWMPNVHRFRLMDWPFELTPNLASWFERISKRDSYQKGLLEWQPAPVPGRFGDYTKQRQEAETDVRQFGSLPKLLAR